MPNAKQEAKCRAKIPYESGVAADFFAMADGLRSYLCPVCRKFHLTSNRVRKGKKSWKKFE